MMMAEVEKTLYMYVVLNRIGLTYHHCHSAPPPPGSHTTPVSDTRRHRKISQPLHILLHVSLPGSRPVYLLPHPRHINILSRPRFLACYRVSQCQ